MSLPYLQPYFGLSNSLQTAQAAGGGAGGIGGWVELARTTLSSSSNSIDITSLPDKRYYMLIGHKIPTGSADFVWRVGNSTIDTGSNYASRFSDNGGADGTQTSNNKLLGDNGGSTTPSIQLGYISNLSNKEKLYIGHATTQNTAGAGTAPIRRESVAKWTNTSNVIDTISGIQQESGSFASGSEAIILGWDPADTHTTNFWEELASVENSGVTDNLSSGTFTAKKYLWVQFYLKPSGNNTQRLLTFNNDTGSNYSRRNSNAGGADGTSTSQANINLADSSGAEYGFYNMFIINNSSNEKLGILHSNVALATGAAAAPWRQEYAFKWTNTSSQITEIDLTNAGAGVDYSISGMKVWGSD